MQTMEEDGLCWDPVFSNQASLSFSWQASRNGPYKIGGQTDTRCRAKGDKGAEWQAWQVNMSKVRLDISTLTRLSFKYKWTILRPYKDNYLNQTHTNQITKHPKQLLQTNLYENFFPVIFVQFRMGLMFSVCAPRSSSSMDVWVQNSRTRLKRLATTGSTPASPTKLWPHTHTQWHGTWGLSMLNSVHIVDTCSKCFWWKYHWTWLDTAR